MWNQDEILAQTPTRKEIFEVTQNKVAEQAETTVAQATAVNYVAELTSNMESEQVEV